MVGLVVEVLVVLARSPLVAQVLVEVHESKLACRLVAGVRHALDEALEVVGMPTRR